MILLIIGDQQLNVLEKIMSKFLDDARAILERIAAGGPGTAEMKADIDALKEKLQANTDADAANAASDDEVKTLILEVLNKLAELQPPQS